MKHEQIETVRLIDFKNLFVSDLNPRTIIDDDEIKRLADNIATVGLIQNVAGLQEDGSKRIGIVAGGRRLRALALLQDDPRFQIIPVLTTSSPDVAKQWATSENANRQNLHPAEEIRSYGMLANDDVSIADISVAYGVTEKHVYRRLALANLPIDVLDALQADKISLGFAAALTTGQDDDKVVEVMHQNLKRIADGYGGMSEYQVKQALRPDTIDSTDRRVVFVGLEAYKSAGGTSTDDLFQETTILNDVELVQSLFEQKLSETTDEISEREGWKWGEYITGSYIPYDHMQEANYGRVYRIEGVLTDEQEARYDELDNIDDRSDDDEKELAAFETILEGDYSKDQKSFAGHIVYLDRDGTIQSTKGLIKTDDRKEAESAGIIEPSAHKIQTAEKKSDISGTLRTDLDRIEAGTRQNAMLNNPTLLLDLLTFQLSGATFYNNAFGIRSNEVSNTPDRDSSFELDKRLSIPQVTTENPFDADLAGDFAKFQKRGRKKIDALLNNLLTSLLSIDDDGLCELVDKKLKRKTRDYWTPDADNFFRRVSGPYMSKLWAELVGLNEDDQKMTDFNKLKKSEKADELADLFSNKITRDALGLNDQQQKRIAEWLPEGMK